MKHKKKLLSLLLSFAMVIQIVVPVSAQPTVAPGISGICTHHIEHTEECGYRQDTPCTHEHKVNDGEADREGPLGGTEDCYTKKLTCEFIEIDAPEIASGSETAHTHDEDCYTQIKKCKHKHTVNDSEADRDGLLGGDEACGYTPGSPCTFGPADCTQCNPGDTPTEKSCTCVPALGAGNAGHDENCPLYTIHELSEAVKALIRMVDALPGADTITEENRQSVKSDFDAALTAYEELSDEDKAVFKATRQHKKLMALRTVLYSAALLAEDTVTLNISNTADYVSITPTGYRVGAAPTETAHTGGYIITGAATSTNATWNHVMVSDGGTHNITLKDASIQLSDDHKAAFVVEGSSTVNLTLEGTNVIKSGDDRAGLQVETGNTLTITSASTGRLSATCGNNGAGIGGGDQGAGIGGGDQGAGGTIKISDGTVIGTSGNNAAGIGGGFLCDGGSITISGGTVTGTSTTSGAGIGGGSNGAGGTITINGGTVTGKGAWNGAGIGGGDLGAGGTVTGTGGTLGAGIGGGSMGEGGSITINGDATVFAQKGTDTPNHMGAGPSGTGFVSLLRSSARVNGSGTGNDTHVKRLLQEDNTTISNTTYDKLPVVKWDGITLTANTDFTVGNITTGTSVPVTVTGMGDYHGSVTKNIAVDAGSGGGDSTSTTLIPNQLSTAQTNAAIITDENGIVTAKADDQDILNAIETAQKSEKQNGIAITLNVQTKENTNSLEVTLSAATVAALSNAKVTQFTIHNGLTGITFDLTALGALAGGEVKLTISKVDVNSLSTEAGNAIGSRPVFRFGASVDGRAVTDFKGGRVSLQMPYIRSTTEQSGNLCGVYVDDNGKVTWLENSSYDSISGNMLTSATHFSIYGVGYKQNTPSFTDVDTHWAKNDIDFVVARGLLTGADSTTFAPEQSMTRGMFVTALGRLANIDTSQYANTTFTDVAPAAYYAPYAAWADASGIVNGTTDTTFSPDNAITRQEMAVMLVNYNNAIGYKLPVVHTEVTFTDAGNIASWAKDAVRQMQMAGILMGKSGNRFEPTAAATRAEASATLRRYVGLVVNPTPLTLLE